MVNIQRSLNLNENTLEIKQATENMTIDKYYWDFYYISYDKKLIIKTINAE